MADEILCKNCGFYESYHDHPYLDSETDKKVCRQFEVETIHASEVDFEDVLLWADGTLYALQTEYADRVTPQEAQTAQAIITAKEGNIMKASFEKATESTPFADIELPHHTIRCYWSLRSGTYGNQVYTVIYHAGDQEPDYYKTDGCGYSKPCAALEWAFHKIGKQPKDMRLGGEEVPYKYKMGGNFYKVPARSLVSIEHARKLQDAEREAQQARWDAKHATA